MENIFITKIIKNGSSLGVVIPVQLLRAYNWQRGDFLIFGFAGGDQMFLKRLSDRELQDLKPNAPII